MAAGTRAESPPFAMSGWTASSSADPAVTSFLGFDFPISVVENFESRATARIGVVPALALLQRIDVVGHDERERSRRGIDVLGRRPGADAAVTASRSWETTVPFGVGRSRSVERSRFPGLAGVGVTGGALGVSWIVTVKYVGEETSGPREAAPQEEADPTEQRHGHQHGRRYLPGINRFS